MNDIQKRGEKPVCVNCRKRKIEHNHAQNDKRCRSYKRALEGGESYRSWRIGVSTEDRIELERFLGYGRLICREEGLQ